MADRAIKKRRSTESTSPLEAEPVGPDAPFPGLGGRLLIEISWSFLEWYELRRPHALHRWAQKRLTPKFAQDLWIVLEPYPNRTVFAIHRCVQAALPNSLSAV